MEKLKPARFNIGKNVVKYVPAYVSSRIVGPSLLFFPYNVKHIFVNDHNHVFKMIRFTSPHYLCITKKISLLTLKVVTTIFLTLTIFLQTFSTYIIQADFFLNRSFIAKNLCVNREKPMMHCNGKCYLSKKLNDQEKQDQQVPVSKNEQFSIQPFFVPRPFLLAQTGTAIKMKYFIKNDQAVASFSHAIFHPPTA